MKHHHIFQWVCDNCGSTDPGGVSYCCDRYMRVTLEIVYVSVLKGLNTCDCRRGAEALVDYPTVWSKSIDPILT